jgi:6-phosphogluconate dehydrogenase
MPVHGRLFALTEARTLALSPAKRQAWVMTTEATAQIAVTGLATMGANLARNLARHGYRVGVHNRTSSRTKLLVEKFGGEGTFVPAETLEDLVASLERPRKIIIMVKAGASTDAVIDELAPLLEPGDILIDGGNAHFEDTRRREAALREMDLRFMGVGISGGEEGALNGPSIMPGGAKEAYEHVGPILEDIAAKVDGEPCCTYVGPDGAGHFVKMVHNGIEYADMQLIAESYDVLLRVGGLVPTQIADVFRKWNQGELESYLVEITAEVLDQFDDAAGVPLVEVITDEAEQKGTGRWTVQVALELGIPVTGIAEAVFARSLSSRVDQRTAVRGAYGETNVFSSGSIVDDVFIGDVSRTLHASKIVAYAQGFDEIRAGSESYDWNIDLAAMAKIWRGGCIIRARLLDRIRQTFEESPEIATLLVDENFRDSVKGAEQPWRRIVTAAVEAGVPTPGMSSALNYYDALRARRLPTALIQGLRDYFGAHTYRRDDKEGVFHTLWSEDRTEIEI